MYLVLNLGLKSIRAVIFDDAHKIILVRSQPLHTYINNKIVEQDAAEWWDKGMAVLRDVIQSITKPLDIDYITVTASSCCLVPVNEKGEPLSRVIMVSDKRAIDEVALIDAVPAYQKYLQEGCVLKNNSSLMLPKILWLKNNFPDVYSAARYFLSPNDYFLYRLTGQSVVDSLSAEKAFSILGTCEYAEDIYDALDIDIAKLPRIETAGSVIGEVNSQSLGLLGLRKPPRAVLTTYDAICAFYGSGPSVEGEACDVSGTVTSLRVMTTSDQITGSENLFTQHEPAFGLKIVGGSNNLGGGLIEWCKQTFYEGKERPYGYMEEDAREVQPGSNGLIFLPYLMGERAPLWNEDAKGVFFGLARHHRRAHMVRAVFEGAGFTLKSLVDEVEKTNLPINRIRVSGGLARLNLINQIKADVTGKEILVLDEFETTAIGAMLLIAKAIDPDLSLQSFSESIKVRQIILPNRENFDEFQERYALFKTVYDALKPSYVKLSELYEKDIYRVPESLENM